MAAEAAVQKAVAVLDRLAVKEDAARQKVRDAREKAATSPRASAKTALVRARDAFSKFRQQKLEGKDALRAAKQELREVARASKLAERSERGEQRKAVAREKAMVAFLKKWEREYDRKMATKPKSPRKRAPKAEAVE